MGQINKKEEKKVESISFHGNRAGISIIALLAVSLCTAAASFRLKETAQIKRWEKALSAYNLQLENENQAELMAAGI